MVSVNCSTHSYEQERLKMTLRKFYGYHQELVDPYDVPMFNSTKVMFTTSFYCGFKFTMSGLLNTIHDLFPNMTVLLSVNSPCSKTCLGICAFSVHVFSYNVWCFICNSDQVLFCVLSFEFVILFFFNSFCI